MREAVESADLPDLIRRANMMDRDGKVSGLRQGQPDTSTAAPPADPAGSAAYQR